MPSFPIVDAHLHLWDPQRFAIPWLDGNATLRRGFGPPETVSRTVTIMASWLDRRCVRGRSVRRVARFLEA